MIKILPFYRKKERKKNKIKDNIFPLDLLYIQLIGQAAELPPGGGGPHQAVDLQMKDLEKINK